MQGAPQDALSLTQVLTYVGKLAAPVVLGGILYLIRAVVRIETILTGAQGNNGMVSDVQALKKAKHRIDNNVNAIAGAIVLTRSEAKLEPLEIRVRAEGE